MVVGAHRNDGPGVRLALLILPASGLKYLRLEPYKSYCCRFFFLLWFSLARSPLPNGNLHSTRSRLHVYIQRRLWCCRCWHDVTLTRDPFSRMVWPNPLQRHPSSTSSQHHHHVQPHFSCLYYVLRWSYKIYVRTTTRRERKQELRSKMPFLLPNKWASYLFFAARKLEDFVSDNLDVRTRYFSSKLITL